MIRKTQNLAAQAIPIIVPENPYDPERWRDHAFREMLGLAPNQRKVPDYDSPEAANALRVARLLDRSAAGFVGISFANAAAHARTTFDRLFCHRKRKPLKSFLHQDGDYHDPGFRMAIAITPVSDALFNGPVADCGVDIPALKKIGDGLAQFHRDHAVVGDDRFAPINALSEFIVQLLRLQPDC